MPGKNKADVLKEIWEEIGKVTDKPVPPLDEEMLAELAEETAIIEGEFKHNRGTADTLYKSEAIDAFGAKYLLGVFETKDPPELIEPNKVMVFEGLHPIYDEKARSQLDLGIYIDIVGDVKFAWKVQRGVAERGWTEEQVREDTDKRLADFSAYVDPQEVKLIQEKGGAFPMITLKKDFELAGGEPGAVLKMYDDDGFGNPATVVEVDG